jgi:hypothetical protein
MSRAGAITPAARQGAEVSCWSAVHGLASLLVEGGLPLGAAERAGACRALLRTLLLGLGVSPELLGPPVGSLRDLRPGPAQRRPGPAQARRRTRMRSPG